MPLRTNDALPQCLQTRGAITNLPARTMSGKVEAISQKLSVSSANRCLIPGRGSLDRWSASALGALCGFERWGHRSELSRPGITLAQAANDQVEPDAVAADHDEAGRLGPPPDPPHVDRGPGLDQLDHGRHGHEPVGLGEA